MNKLLNFLRIHPIWTLIVLVVVWTLAPAIAGALAFGAKSLFAEQMGLEYPTWQVLGTVGDTFGLINSLFSGLALVLVAVSLYFQKEEMRELVKETTKQVHAHSLRQEFELLRTRLELSTSHLGRSGIPAHRILTELDHGHARLAFFHYRNQYEVLAAEEEEQKDQEERGVGSGKKQRFIIETPEEWEERIHAELERNPHLVRYWDQNRDLEPNQTSKSFSRMDAIVQSILGTASLDKTSSDGQRQTPDPQ